MPRIEEMAEQITLLLSQRLVLISGRYCNITQLREHDHKLLRAATWLKHVNSSSTEHWPAWLGWLLSDDTTLLPQQSVLSMGLTAESWLVLHQLKQRLYQNISLSWQIALQQAVNANASSPLWLLAYYLSLEIDLVDAESALSEQALWYQFLIGSTNTLPYVKAARAENEAFSLLKQLLVARTIEDYQTAFSGYAPAELIASLQNCHSGLCFLIAAADDATQSKVINYLSQKDPVLAVEAMGQSGQLKYVPLLTELAQGADLAEQSANALALLLGILESDNYLQTIGSEGGQFKTLSGRVLSGGPQNVRQFDSIWQAGNTKQRQVVSCLRRRQNGGRLVAADALQVTS